MSLQNFQTKIGEFKSAFQRDPQTFAKLCALGKTINDIPAFILFSLGNLETLVNTVQALEITLNSLTQHLNDVERRLRDLVPAEASVCDSCAVELPRKLRNDMAGNNGIQQ